MANAITSLLSGIGSKLGAGAQTIGNAYGSVAANPVASTAIPVALALYSDAAMINSNTNLNKSTDAYAAKKKRMGETGNTGVNIKEFADDLLQTNKISQKE